MARCMGSDAIAEFPEHDEQVAVCLRQFRGNAKSVKVLDEAQGLIGGWGIPFGGPMEGKDLEGEAFTPDTNFCFDWFPNEGRPLLYEHGMDSKLGLDVIGQQTAKFVDPEQGVWVEAQLNMAHRYASVILDLAKKGILGFSSGALGGYVRRQGTKITQWPWIEQTLTPRPANPYALVPPDAVKHLELAGADIPDAVKTPPVEDQDETIKAGRAMSSKNLGQMHAAMADMQDLHDATCDMGEDCPIAGQKRLNRIEVTDKLTQLIQHLHDQECPDGKNCPMTGEFDMEAAMLAAAKKRRDLKSALYELQGIVRQVKVGGA